MVRYVTLTFILIITLAMTACGNNSAATTPEPAADLAVIATEATDDPAEEPTNAAEAADTIETTISANAPSSNYLDSYTIDDTGFGTQVNAVVDDETKTRTIESNALPNHETGEFPNPGNPNTISEQDKSWTFTTEPIFVGTPK